MRTSYSLKQKVIFRAQIDHSSTVSRCLLDGQSVVSPVVSGRASLYPSSGVTVRPDHAVELQPQKRVISHSEGESLGPSRPRATLPLKVLGQYLF